MQLVGKQMTVPVPRVLTAWTDKRGQTHLVMKRIGGRELGLPWKNYSIEERKAVASQLKDYVVQYRAIRSPGTTVGLADYSPFDNELFCLDGKGPFKDVSDFHYSECSGYSMKSPPNTWPNLRPSTPPETSHLCSQMGTLRHETFLSKTARSSKSSMGDFLVGALINGSTPVAGTRIGGILTLETTETTF
jgi:hypothetical protein